MPPLCTPPGALRDLTGGTVKGSQTEGLGLRAPFSQPQPTPHIGPFPLLRHPGLSPELAKEPFQRGVMDPWLWPAGHPAPCHPFLNQLLVEAMRSRPLYHGSQALQPEA